MKKPRRRKARPELTDLERAVLRLGRFPEVAIRVKGGRGFVWGVSMGVFRRDPPYRPNEGPFLLVDLSTATWDPGPERGGL